MNVRTEEDEVLSESEELASDMVSKSMYAYQKELQSVRDQISTLFRDFPRTKSLGNDERYATLKEMYKSVIVDRLKRIQGIARMRIYQIRAEQAFSNYLLAYLGMKIDVSGTLYSNTSKELIEKLDECISVLEHQMNEMGRAQSLEHGIVSLDESEERMSEKVASDGVFVQVERSVDTREITLGDDEDVKEISIETEKSEPKRSECADANVQASVQKGELDRDETIIFAASKKDIPEPVSSDSVLVPVERSVDTREVTLGDDEDTKESSIEIEKSEPKRSECADANVQASVQKGELDRDEIIIFAASKKDIPEPVSSDSVLVLVERSVDTREVTLGDDEDTKESSIETEKSEPKRSECADANVQASVQKGELDRDEIIIFAASKKDIPEPVSSDSVLVPVERSADTREVTLVDDEDTKESSIETEKSEPKRSECADANVQASVQKGELDRDEIIIFAASKKDIPEPVSSDSVLVLVERSVDTREVTLGDDEDTKESSIETEKSEPKRSECADANVQASVQKGELDRDEIIIFAASKKDIPEPVSSDSVLVPVERSADTREVTLVDDEDTKESSIETEKSEPKRSECADANVQANVEKDELSRDETITCETLREDMPELVSSDSVLVPVERSVDAREVTLGVGEKVKETSTESEQKPGKCQVYLTESDAQTEELSEDEIISVRAMEKRASKIDKHRRVPVQQSLFVQAENLEERTSVVNVHSEESSGTIGDSSSHLSNSLKSLVNANRTSIDSIKQRCKKGIEILESIIVNIKNCLEVYKHFLAEAGVCEEALKEVKEVIEKYEIEIREVIGQWNGSDGVPGCDISSKVSPKRNILHNMRKTVNDCYQVLLESIPQLSEARAKMSSLSTQIDLDECEIAEETTERGGGKEETDRVVNIYAVERQRGSENLHHCQGTHDIEIELPGLVGEEIDIEGQKEDNCEAGVVQSEREEMLPGIDQDLIEHQRGDNDEFQAICIASEPESDMTVFGEIDDDPRGGTDSVVRLELIENENCVQKAYEDAHFEFLRNIGEEMKRNKTRLVEALQDVQRLANYNHLSKSVTLARTGARAVSKNFSDFKKTLSIQSKNECRVVTVIARILLDEVANFKQFIQKATHIIDESFSRRKKIRSQAKIDDKIIVDEIRLKNLRGLLSLEDSKLEDIEHIASAEKEYQIKWLNSIISTVLSRNEEDEKRVGSIETMSYEHIDNHPDDLDDFIICFCKCTEDDLNKVVQFMDSLNGEVSIRTRDVTLYTTDSMKSNSKITGNFAYAIASMEIRAKRISQKAFMIENTLKSSSDAQMLSLNLKLDVVDVVEEIVASLSFAEYV